jgi:RNA-directed DNA polymerase
MQAMKRANHLMPCILDMDNLRLAFWKASKGKRYAALVRDYQSNLQNNLLRLRDQIESGQKICTSTFRRSVCIRARTA